MQQSQSQSQALVVDGKYQLGRCLGEGGMGSVYEGKHLGTGRRVAVKLVSPEVLAKGPELAERFRREAMASGAIESQYIAHVMDTGIDAGSGSPYIVMELLVGEDLSHAIKRVRRFTPDTALRIAAHACMGLQKAHAAGVIHRDVKPANLFLTRRDDEVVVKLLDFGIAKVSSDRWDTEDAIARFEAERTRTGMMLGSPLYMSPEQARGKKTIDHRSDVFSLGVVLYEMLAGRTPHAKSESLGDLVVRICGEPARPVQEIAPSVTAAVAAVVHKALALDVAARFASAAEMLAAIRALVPAGVGLDGSVLPVPVEEPSRPSMVTAIRASVASRPDATSAPHAAPAPSGERLSRTPPAPARSRAMEDSAATIANTPASKLEPKAKEVTRPPIKSVIPPAKEAMQRRIFIPAAKKAALGLWGEDGLNLIAGALENDTRSEFFRAVGGDEWVPSRFVIEWCLRTFEGPCLRDRNKMAEYVDRTYDLSYGVVRKLVVKLADPVSVVPRLAAFWKQDHTEGDLSADLDPSGKGCTIRIAATPYAELPHSRAGMAEIYRYAFSQTRAKAVTEAHALERPEGKIGAKPVLVIRLRWQ